MFPLCLPLPSLGPLTHATLLCPDVEKLADVYARYLDMAVKRKEALSAKAAQLLGVPQSAPCLWLGPQGADEACWLRLVSGGEWAQPAKPLRKRGWMALEVLVEDVDRVARQLQGSPFVVLGEPANLAVSEHIRAMQVRGIAGEVLYLTEVRGAVPPFELPRAQHPVDGLFIAVLAAGEGSASGAFYHRLGHGHRAAERRDAAGDRSPAASRACCWRRTVRGHCQRGHLRCQPAAAGLRLERAASTHCGLPLERSLWRLRFGTGRRADRICAI